MAKFYGKVGYVLTEETAPDVWMPVEVERDYYGDSLNLTSLRRGVEVNDNIELSCEIQILADPYAFEHYAYIKYVVIDGFRWSVKSVKPRYPRLVLSIGGVYNEQSD